MLTYTEKVNAVRNMWEIGCSFDEIMEETNLTLDEIFEIMSTEEIKF